MNKSTEIWLVHSLVTWCSLTGDKNLLHWRYALCLSPKQMVYVKHKRFVHLPFTLTGIVERNMQQIVEDGDYSRLNVSL